MARYSKEFSRTIAFAFKDKITKSLEEVVHIQNRVVGPVSNTHKFTYGSEERYRESKTKMRDAKVQEIKALIKEYNEFALDFNDNSRGEEEIAPILLVYAYPEDRAWEWIGANYEYDSVVIFNRDESAKPIVL